MLYRHIMKQFRTPIIIASALCGFILCAIYLATLISHTEPRRSRWTEARHQLEEIAEIKNQHSATSAYFARFAREEQRHTAAALLQAISKADEIQCQSCKKAITILGGSNHPTAASQVKASTTAQHLQQIISTKTHCHSNHFLHFSHDMAQSGNRYIVRLITWCDASDIHQIRLLRREIAEFDSANQPRRRYYVCPTCSNVSDDEFISHFCPYCMTSFEEFFIFE